MDTNFFKISKSTFQRAILGILLFNISCINLPYFPGYTKIKYLSIIIIGILLVKKIRIFYIKKYSTINSILTIFCVFVIVPSIVNERTSLRNTFLASIVFVVVCFETMFTMEYIAEVGKIFETIKLYYALTLLFVILTDVIAIITPGLFGNEGIAARYLVGTKFNVMYLHLQLITLYVIKAQPFKNYEIEPKIVVLIYVILTLWVSGLVDCNTGLIGCFLLLVMLLFTEHYYETISSPRFFIGTLLLSCSFAFFYEILLQSTLVQNIISDIFERSLTLTGRTDIYALLPIVLSRHPILGYGYGSAYEIAMSSFGYANTQNGLAQWLINVGILGTVTFLLWIYSAFKEWKKEVAIKRRYMPIVALLYVYSALASVEITIDFTFIFWVAFIVGVAMEQSLE